MIAPRLELALLVAVLISLSPLDLQGQSDADNAPATWTVMLYMAGDATPELPWDDNINAMEAADQALGTSIVALVDPLGAGNSELLKIQQDPNGFDGAIVSTPIQDDGEVIPVDGEVNMGEPSTLAQFLQFTGSHYPATRKVLVLWGHGAGWAGICPDGTDLFTLPELRTALESAGADFTPDLIAVDACAAATFEMLYEVRDHVDYFVAAEGNVPFQGLPYTSILSDLAADTGISVSEFGSLIASDYIHAVAAVSPYSTTMGVFDMSKLPGVSSQLSALSAVGLKYDDIFHDAFNEAVNEAEAYDIPYYFDLGDFLSKLQHAEVPLDLKTLAIAGTNAYRDMVVTFEKFDHPDPFDGIKVTDATGVAIYAPSTAFTDDAYADLALASTEWYDFGTAARIMRATEQRDQGPDVSYSDSPGDNDSLADSVTLTWPVPYDEYSVWTFRHEPGGYVLLHHGSYLAQSVTISSYIGDLLIAATATHAGEAVTYDELNVTLYGMVVATVQLTIGGEVPSEAYDVRVVMNGMTWYFRAEEGMARLNLSLPTQVQVGELLLFEVLSPSSDRVLGSARATVQDHDFTVEIALIAAGGEPSGYLVPLLFSLLPGALVLVFAAMLYLEDRRQKKG